MTIRFKRSKLFLYAISLFFILALSVFLIVFDFRSISDDAGIFNNDWIYCFFKIFFILTLPLYGVCIYWYIKKLIKNDMFISLDDEYLLDYSSFISLGKIKLTDIENVYSKDMFVCIKLKNPEAYLTNIKGVKKMLINFNKKMKYEYVCIAKTFLGNENLKFINLLRKAVDKKKN